MIFIVVQVNEDVKILTGPLAKEVDENDLFSNLFDSLTSEKYSHYNIQVEVKTTQIQSTLFIVTHLGQSISGDYEQTVL
ncbi:hypothetical protein GLOIN_2v1787393 [Rhizophagus irregularis DAOM 181602=DAOM 197198]|uniref:Uncharacterized protein n=1 Tax=Rhizophagus irregularis (strain DAOM 181602 / DAOM 197198 / MUCL 43194) TaxID=747089 RepID=A0A2P4P5Z9_RHIID|nr:hypothetical protein GLOIN_2v1787393 [Rhizophagus irregularis DAOM 181602=DAOM 197198]POG60815.1 hypothetical protein GLOIN_2v1787393 [Rhizophagus irregularis DAOM 181602=DAOM 197198]GET52545.1 hypothetical protein GLOIN_2v1787393 [Rhizophagus irregularis DAOM 181602=DAOM 197198]|eukprot:XP_025167681.1 hypothetical protein GLOIN_2v1787393 [Rhizophagus irregularis DAOM 181602=DAOM 197198]